MSHITLVIEIVLEKATQEPAVHSSCCSPESNAAHNIPMDIVNGFVSEEKEDWDMQHDGCIDSAKEIDDADQ